VHALAQPLAERLLPLGYGSTVDRRTVQWGTVVWGTVVWGWADRSAVQWGTVVWGRTVRGAVGGRVLGDDRQFAGDLGVRIRA
jgi:hypothetical protein